MKVLVTGVTWNSGIAIIRGLARNGCKVIGADDRNLPKRLHSRYTKPYYVYPGYEEGSFINAIVNILKEEKPDVMLPMCRTKWVSKNRKEIEKYCKLLVPDYESFMVAYDNKETLGECKEIGIACPEIFTEKEAINKLSKNVNRKNKLKVVIKPRRDVGGAKGLSIVYDVDTFKKNKRESERAYGEAVIEEYIPGDTENMRTVNLMFDKKSNLAAYFTTKKIRQWPTSGGISALSVSTNEWNLVEMVLPFFKKWQWQGPAEIEIQIEQRDYIPKLIEINPRFPGYVGFSIKCGLNLPMIACKLSQGQNDKIKEYSQYKIGIKYINPSAYFKAVTSDIFHSKNKIQAITSALTDLKGIKVNNSIELRDFKPIIGKILLELKSIIK